MIGKGLFYIALLALAFLLYYIAYTSGWLPQTGR